VNIGPRPGPDDDGTTTSVRYLNRLPSSERRRGSGLLRLVRDVDDEPGNEHDLRADTRAEAVRAAVSAPSADSALHSIIDMAMESGPWDDSGLITVDESGALHSACASSPTVGRLDALQNALGEGPAVDSLAERGRVAIVSDDLLADGRWPRWAEAATGAGVAAALSLRLFTDRTYGALTLYWSRRHTIEEAALAEADAIAAQASVILAYTVAEARRCQALERHSALGQAEGILMQRFGVSASGAGAVLRSYADQQEIDVAELARRITNGRPPAGGCAPTGRPPTVPAAEGLSSIFHREA
jgi:transcriptional regulator with GAF, ATPase, and Fis domain